MITIALVLFAYNAILYSCAAENISISATSSSYPIFVTLKPTDKISTTKINATASAIPREVTTEPTELACWQEGGEISEEFISSRLLPKRLDFMLYLPPCYAQQPNRQYPVLYLIHGKSFTHDQWIRLGADEIADKLIGTGELAPFIMVMPRDRIWVEPPENMFGEAIVQELIPWITDNYRSIDNRQSRAIGGLSRGAAWAVHLGFGRWDLFGTVGAHSMALFWEDKRMLPKWLDDMKADGFPNIFVDVGNRDFLEIRTASNWFSETLTAFDIPHEWYSYTGTHNEEYWSAHIEQYIRFYASGW